MFAQPAVYVKNMDGNKLYSRAAPFPYSRTGSGVNMCTITVGFQHALDSLNTSQ